VFIIILLSFSRVYRTYLSPFFDKYLFSVKHPYDTESVFIITVKEEDAKEVKKEDYLIAKDEGGLISNIIDPIKHFKEYKRNIPFSHGLQNQERHHRRYKWSSARIFLSDM
jgi:hypothetical protein